MECGAFKQPARRSTSLLTLGLTLLLHAANVSATGGSPSMGKEQFLAALLEQMSLPEKVGQLRMKHSPGTPPSQYALDTVAKGAVGALFTEPGFTREQLRAYQDAAVQRGRLGIPVFFAGDVVHGHRTVFPIGLGQASSWDLQAIGSAARIAAIEASADGLDMTFAPMVDLSRDPRWGRMSEGFGEDPYLVSRIAERVTQQLQGPTLGAADSIMACVKHFAAYGAVEGGRDYNTTNVSTHQLFQDYLPPYQAALEAGAGAVMTALTTLNGVPATANRWLLRDILRQQWRYRGLVISDHSAVQELVAHGTAAGGEDAAQAALVAGTQMSMNDRYFEQALAQLIEQGAVPVSLLDEAVHQVLATKYDLGLFHDPYRRLGHAQHGAQPSHDPKPLHRAQAREVARRSLVLLKNQNALLPLVKRGTVAVIGPLADNPVDILGSWHASGQPGQAISLYQGLKTAVGDDAKLLYALGANISDKRDDFLLLADKTVNFDPRPPQALLAEAVAIAQQADVIVVALGEARGMSHEGASKTDLNLPTQQRELLQALKRTGKPLVLVLMNGRPLTIVEESQWADAVLETWFSGTEGGNAIADVLFGDYNPSGKLPVTFPRSVGQIPPYYAQLNTGRPFDPQQPSAYRSHYFDTDNTPLYPFGYGLSYTHFSLSPLTLSTHRLRPGHAMQVSVTLKNEGQRTGETTVQLYLRDRVASVSRPLKELKGFQKVLLAPGESRQIVFDIDTSMLAFYNQHLQRVTEPGTFDVMIGLDSQDLQKASFELDGTPP